MSIWLIFTLLAIPAPHLQRDISFKLREQLSFRSESNSTSLYIKFQVDKIFAEQGIAFQFKPFSNLLCPSYAHWFKKDSPHLAALSFGLACDKFENAPSIRIELARDWTRLRDEIQGNTYFFEARLDYQDTHNEKRSPVSEPVSLEEYGLLEVNEIRVRSAPPVNSQTGEPLDFTFYIKGSTIIFN